VVVQDPLAGIHIFVPVEQAGAVTYVIQLSLGHDWLAGLLARASRGNIDVRLAAPDGSVLDGQGPPWHGGAAILGTVLPGAPGRQIARAELDGIPIVLAQASIPHAPGFVLLACEPEADFDETIRRPFEVVTIIALICIGMALAGSFLIGTRLTRPLRRLSEAAQAIVGGGETIADVPTSFIAEFNNLHENLVRAERVVRRRAAAERLALNEARTGHEILASVVNATADQILVKDLDLRYVLTNRATLLLPFMNRDEWQLLGRRCVDLDGVPDAEIAEQLDREVIATGEPRRRQFKWQRLDGVLSSFLVTKTPWRNAAGAIAGVVTVVHDITDATRAEQRLAAVQGELLRAARLSAMGAMASGLAHELNQPLAAATNFLNAAARLLSRSPPDAKALELARGAVTDAVGQTLRAGAIVRRLREFVGRGEADLKLDDMADLIREACDVARTDRATRASQLTVRVPATQACALVDRTQVQQVLLNLIRNAAEAIDDAPGGRIEVACSTSAAGIEIVVADNGPGIAPDMVDRLFQPFASNKALGMGIGLAICRTIIEGHGGTLCASANPGGGARFRILLPPAPTHFPHPALETTTQ
jgi:two-component system sensor kinase FixL